MNLLILKGIEDEERRIIRENKFCVGDIVIQTRDSCLIPQGMTCIITDIDLSRDFPYKIRPINSTFHIGLWWPAKDIKHKESEYAFNF